MKSLNRKVGEMNYDGLITDLNPPVQVDGRSIAMLPAEMSFPRGTVFARSIVDHKLYVLGSVPVAGDELVPDCILCDDTDVGVVCDVSVAVYTAGCFDPDKLSVAGGYKISEADMDGLRVRNIVFKAAIDPS